MSASTSNRTWTSKDVTITTYPEGLPQKQEQCLREEKASLFAQDRLKALEITAGSGEYAAIRPIREYPNQPFHLVTDTRIQEALGKFHRFGLSSTDRSCPFSPAGNRDHFVAVVGHHSPISAYQKECKQLRKVIAKYFTHQRLDGLEQRWKAECEKRVEQWIQAGEINLCQESLRLAMAFTAKHILGCQRDTDALSDALSSFFAPFPSSLVRSKDWPSSPQNLLGKLLRLFRRMIAFLRDIPSLISKIKLVYWDIPQRIRPMARRVIRQELEKTDPDGLSFVKFMKAEGCTPDQMEDTFLTMLVAGQETLGYLIAYALHECSQDSDLQERIHQDTSLELQRKVIYETLRKYPTGGATRRVREDMVIEWPEGTYAVRQDDWVSLEPMPAGRDKRFWNEPERFDPERPGIEKLMNKPFGSGFHHCVGKQAALREAQVTVDTVMKRAQIGPKDPRPELVLETTLKPIRDYRITVTARTPQ